MAPAEAGSPMNRGGTFLRFLGTGLLNTAFGYISYALLILVGAPIWVAVGGATLLGVVFNFFSYGKLVFGPPSLDRLPAFMAVYAFLYGLNVALVHLLLANNLDPFMAQALVLPLLAALAFLLMRFFVFTPRSHHKRRRQGHEANADHNGC